jgi:hypothetical protein
VLNDPTHRDNLSAIPLAEFTLDSVVSVLPFSAEEVEAINELNDGNKQKIAFAIRAALDSDHALNVSWHPASGAQRVEVTPATTLARGLDSAVVSILIRSRYEGDGLG